MENILLKNTALWRQLFQQIKIYHVSSYISLIINEMVILGSVGEMSDKWKVKAPDYLRGQKRPLTASDRAEMLEEPTNKKSAKELGEVSALNFACRFKEAGKQERYDRNEVSTDIWKSKNSK